VVRSLKPLSHPHTPLARSYTWDMWLSNFDSNSQMAKVGPSSRQLLVWFSVW